MVTGSREWLDKHTINRALEEIPGPATLIHGCATGADHIARSWAVANDWDIEDYWPDYYNFRPQDAPKARNALMVNSMPDIVLAFPMPRSRGTWHAVGLAKTAGIPVRIYEPL